MHSSLLAHISKFITLTNEESSLLPLYFESIELKKKAFLLKQGQVCRANYFVVKGCLHTYFKNEQDTSQVIQFAIENWWLSDHMSLITQQPSQFFIQAVEPAQVLALHKEAEEEMFARIPAMERYFRIVLQKAYAASQLRFKYLYDFSGSERYFHFIASFPEFAQRIPQYMLTSYLGFTPEFLSKIRAKKSHSPKPIS